jgi:predicted component of type VI protein secretion system
MNTPAWLRRAVLADPGRFGLLAAAQALPEARLHGPRSLALARCEIEAVTADGGALQTAVLGLAGPQSPQPAAMAQELAALEPETAAAGLLALIEDRLLRLLVQGQVRRAVDDPAAHQAALDRLAGPLSSGETYIIGRLCDGRTADALASHVAQVTGCAVRVLAATGGCLPLGSGCSDVLGKAALGSEQTIGRQVSAPDLGCRIEIGPVDGDMAQRLRPAGGLHAALLEAIARGMPPCMRWEVRLLVICGSATPCGLGSLGCTMRLDGRTAKIDSEILARDG